LNELVEELPHSAGTDINFRSSKIITALHLVSALIRMYSIKIILHKGMSVIFTVTYEFTPLHVSVGCDNVEAMKAYVERGTI